MVLELYFSKDRLIMTQKEQDVLKLNLGKDIEAVILILFPLQGLNKLAPIP